MNAPERLLRPGPQEPYTLSHTAERLRCYTGESLALHTRVDVRERSPRLSLRIGIPEGAELVDFYASSPATHGALRLEVAAESARGPEVRWLAWRSDWDHLPGERHEFVIHLRVLDAGEIYNTDHHYHTWLVSRAEVAQDGRPGSRIDETVSVAVFHKGQYLEHLPALYEQDSFMSRFVMLFESFWGPIDHQIDHIADYFDPGIAPAQMLPWLASWFNLTMNEQWPEVLQRRLLANAFRLYRMRGTRAGLQELLEIFADGAGVGAQVKIDEHRADNFQLGPNTHIGPGIAVGRRNRPFTFTVRVKLLQQLPAGASARSMEQITQLLRSVIDAEKPAHTSYTLDIIQVSPDAARSGAE